MGNQRTPLVILPAVTSGLGFLLKGDDLLTRSIEKFKVKMNISLCGMICVVLSVSSLSSDP